MIFIEYKYWVIAGTLLGIAFLHPLLWWLGLFGVWFSYEAILTAKRKREIFIGTIIMGSLHFSLAIIWAWSVYPINDYPISPFLQLIAVFMTWSLSALVLCLGKLVLTVPVYLFSSIKNPFIFAFLWMVSDIAGAISFSVVSYAPGSSVNSIFSFGWLGYLFGNHGLLLPLAEVGGVFILTFLYVLVGLYLRQLWQSKLRRPGFIVSGAIILLFFAGFIELNSRTYDENLKVAALESQKESIMPLSSSEAKLYEQEIFSSVGSAVAEGYSYVILPEGMNFTKYFPSQTEVLNFLKNNSPNDVILVDSGQAVGESGTNYVRARIYDTSSMSVYELDKQYLVPQGEHMPYLFSGLMKLFGFSEAVKRFQSSFNYVPGDMLRGDDWPDNIPGVLFCSESIDPFGVRKASNNGEYVFVAHIVSHAWFNEPHILWNQLDQILKVNTRFVHTVVYQAANMYESKRY